VFIPAAEASGAIVAIGDLVLSTVAEDVRRWSDAGILPPDSRIAMNVSATEFEHGQYIERLSGVLADAGVSAHRIELEITESLLVQDLQAAARRLHDLDQLGFLIALDDFGTGYSSLTYLKRLPASTIKIDRSFVSGMLSDPGDRAIVLGVIGLARVFGREAVAEGVETPAHIAALREAGCALGQGYGIAPAMPAERFEAWARSHVPGSYTSVPAGAPPCKTR
jgi:EAL domain-containing protein (putative c-di-GMP-specific phosphodiesterase class I)